MLLPVIEQQVAALFSKKNELYIDLILIPPSFITGEAPLDIRGYNIIVGF